ncbi:hypothetical protein L7F22_038898 [Adiantum nelumboides]|nr:hypothetical protein [Adiantum nelumboides]
MFRSSRTQSNQQNAVQADGLPPPPPYEPVASNTQPRVQQHNSQTQQFAPPPFPPPGSAPIAQTGSQSSNPFQQSAQAAGQSSVLHQARKMSNDFTGVAAIQSSTRRQPSIKENQLEFLRAYDTIFIVDDSSSMNVNERPDGSMGKSRWEEARDAMAGMVELAAKYDDDGVELHFLNSEKCLLNCRDPRQVKQLFDSILPEGLTPTGTKLEMLLLQYMDDIETHKQTKVGTPPKKRNYVIITDGTPTDDPESVIVAIASRLDRGNFPLTQIGVQFVQVGDDADAREALEELDDALQAQHSCRDIVDTVPYSGMALNPDLLVKALLGGINRRLDRQAANPNATK